MIPFQFSSFEVSEIPLLALIVALPSGPVLKFPAAPPSPAPMPAPPSGAELAYTLPSVIFILPPSPPLPPPMPAPDREVAITSPPVISILPPAA